MWGEKRGFWLFTSLTLKVIIYIVRVSMCGAAASNNFKNLTLVPKHFFSSQSKRIRFLFFNLSSLFSVISQLIWIFFTGPKISNEIFLDNEDTCIIKILYQSFTTQEYRKLLCFNENPNCLLATCSYRFESWEKGLLGLFPKLLARRRCEMMMWKKLIFFVQQQAKGGNAIKFKM